MKVDIYRVCEKTAGGFLHEQICRSCADKFHKKGYEIEFDHHLSKYMYVYNGLAYYEDGTDENNDTIECSICDEPLVSELEPLKCVV